MDNELAYCKDCDAEDRRSYDAGPFRHKPDCIVTQAQVLLVKASLP